MKYFVPQTTLLGFFVQTQVLSGAFCRFSAKVCFLSAKPPNALCVNLQLLAREINNKTILFHKLKHLSYEKVIT